MASNKNHHYAPQFLIRRFSTIPRSVHAFLVNYSKHIPNASIRNCAQRNRYYRDNKFEQALANLEGMSSMIIRDICVNNSVPKINSAEHFILMYFTLLQSMRTPKTQAEFDEFVDTTTKHFLPDNVLPENMRDVFQITWRDSHLQAMNIIGQTVPLLLDLRLKCIVAEGTSRFVLSDNPSSRYNMLAEKIDSIYGSGGLVQSGFLNFLPVSPKHCLVHYDENIYKIGGRRMGNGIVRATDSDIEQLNVLQAINAVDHIFYTEADQAESIEKIAAKAAKQRTESDLKFQTLRNKNEPTKELLWLQKTGIRIGLDLSFAKFVPGHKRFVRSDGFLLPRDPLRLHYYEIFMKEKKKEKGDGHVPWDDIFSFEQWLDQRIKLERVSKGFPVNRSI